MCHCEPRLDRGVAISCSTRSFTNNQLPFEIATSARGLLAMTFFISDAISLKITIGVSR